LKNHHPYRERHHDGKISSRNFPNPKCDVVRHASNLSYNHPVHLPGTPTIYANPVK
jgi:hypothetical protein